MNAIAKDSNSVLIKWPKYVTELHVHLGGSVPLYRLWEIGIDRGIRGLGDGYEEFINLVKIQDDRVGSLDAYLQVYDRIELIQSGPNAIRESVIIAAHRAYRTGGMPQVGPGGEGASPSSLFSIRRLELRWNPMKRTGAVFLKGSHAGLYDVDRVIKAACEAAEDAEIGFHDKMQIGLLFCFGRDMTRQANETLAKKIRKWRDKTDKIIGIDLAGPESMNALNDPEKLKEMKEIFNMAGLGLGRTVHVGETNFVDLDTFIATIEALEPARVGHPITAIKAYIKHDDDRGLKLLRDRDIVCELCIKSNLLTGAVHNIMEYKDILKALDEYKIKYTFSTDAPSLQGTSLAEELLLLLDNKVATPNQILKALKNAEENTFLSPKVFR